MEDIVIRPRQRPKTAKPARASSPRNKPERQAISRLGNMGTEELLGGSSAPDAFLMAPPLLLGLQRLAGNRAVSALVRKADRTSDDDHAGGAGEPVVQTTRKGYSTTHAPTPTAQGEFETFADEVSKLVDTANTELTDLSFVKGWVDTPPGTRISYFQENWKKHVAKPTTSTALLAAAAGYAIESQVTQLMMTKGMTRPYVVQDPQGGTRPDIVVKASDGTEGWIDLTSKEEAAKSHILNKSPSWLTRVNVPFVEENWYPTVPFVAMAAVAGFGKVPKAKKDRKEQGGGGHHGPHEPPGSGPGAPDHYRGGQRRREGWVRIGVRVHRLGAEKGPLLCGNQSLHTQKAPQGSEGEGLRALEEQVGQRAVGSYPVSSGMGSPDATRSSM